MAGHIQVLAEDSLDFFLREIDEVEVIFCGVDETTCIKFKYLSPFAYHLNLLVSLKCTYPASY
jgi:hypothetical protein